MSKVRKHFGFPLSSFGVTHLFFSKMGGKNQHITRNDPDPMRP